MSAALVEVVSAPDGTPVACKRSDQPALHQRLRHEAALLEVLAHPGVVQLRGLLVDGDQLGLLTAWLPGGTLADALPLPRGRALRILAGVAATTADLHAGGHVHGRLTADHVLLDAGDRPVLCGLAEGGPATPHGLADDVAALGVLVDLALERPALDSLRRGTHRTLDWDLVALAARAHDPDPAARPAAATLAGALAGALDREAAPPAASQPGTAATRPQRWPGPLRPARWAGRPAAVAGGAAGLVLLVMLGLTTVLGAGPASTAAGPPSSARPAPPTAEPGPTVASTTLPDSTLPDSTPPDTAPPRTPEPTPTVASPPRPDATPADAVVAPAPASPARAPARAAVVEGTRITLPDGRRFDVGEPGDVVAVGDWDCDGTPTAAVLRPATGEVFVFATWPDGEAAAIRPLAVVPGATVLQPRPGAGPTCFHLAVRDLATGATQVVL